MSNLKATIWVVMAISVFAALSWAANAKVDQGMPGNQGAWPVTCVSGCSGTGGGSGSDSFDGGVSIIFNQQCSLVSNITTAVSGSSQIIPASLGMDNRAYIQICNSLQNGDGSLLKCLPLQADGGNPVFAIGNPGDMLAVGDCIRYDLPKSIAVNCISNGTNIQALSSECRP